VLRFCSNILRLKCTKFNFCWGCTPGPAGNLQRSPDPGLREYPSPFPCLGIFVSVLSRRHNNNYNNTKFIKRHNAVRRLQRRIPLFETFWRPCFDVLVSLMRKVAAYSVFGNVKSALFSGASTPPPRQP